MTQGEPLLQAYLDVLPNGLDSYPECRTKCALLLSSLEGIDPQSIVEGLDPVLQELVLHPPSQGLWAPTVHVDAIFYAICERHYPTEQDVIEWVRKRTQGLGASPLYRSLLRVSGPRVFFSVSVRAQRIFQRGTDLENLLLESHRLRSRLSFPPHLHTRLNLLGNLGLYEASAELTGGKHAKAQMLDYGPTHATFECTWE